MSSASNGGIVLHFCCVGCLRTFNVAEAKVGRDGVAWNVCLWCAPTKWHLADPLRVEESSV